MTKFIARQFRFSTIEIADPHGAPLVEFMLIHTTPPQRKDGYNVKTANGNTASVVLQSYALDI